MKLKQLVTNLIEKSWFGKAKWTYVLFPFSGLFWLISFFRRKAYQIGLLQTHVLPVPIIVVGNISVGGNGKTPLVIRLADLLKQQGYRPGVLSRGYGGNAPRYPFSVDADALPAEVGDEPVLMRQRLSCPVVIDPNRTRGAKYLIESHQCNVIVCDDGMQHYALDRDLEIAVIDGERRNGNGWVLPVGPLREGAWRLSQVDYVVVNGGSAQQNEHLMGLEAGQLINVKYPSQSKGLGQLHKAVVGLAGIGHPQRFYRFLSQRQVKLKQCLSFPDHYQFNESDIPNDTVIMTEKDAVKCRQFAHDDCWYLPVSAKLTAQFESSFLEKVKSLKSAKS